MEKSKSPSLLTISEYIATGQSPVSRKTIYAWIRDGLIPVIKNGRSQYLVDPAEIAKVDRRLTREPADPLAALSPDDRDAARDYVARAVAAAPALGPEAMARVAAALSVGLQQRAAAPAEIAGAA